MKSARFVLVFLFAVATFASAAQLNTVPSAGQTFPAGGSGPVAAVLQKPSFALPVVYGTGGNPISVAVADVNGDGKPDLLVTNNSAGGNVGVLLGNGDGTFQPAVTYSSGGILPDSVTVGDVNGDGKLDLVVANQCAAGGCGNLMGSVGVLLGNGDGTFQPVVTYSSGGEFALSVAVEDVNGDGNLDLLVANACGSGCTKGSLGSVGVLLGNGDGTFQPVVTYATAVGTAQGLAVADVNGDRKLDLLVPSTCGLPQSCPTSGVNVLLGNGDGTFQAAVLYGTGADGASAIAVSDVNGDGKLDLLVTTSSNSFTIPEVGVLLGNGDGTFQPVAFYGTGGVLTFGSIAVGDLNGDGKPDLLVNTDCGSNCGHNKVTVLLGNGDGTFQAGLTYATGWYGPRSVALADVNRDGKLDMVVVNTGFNPPGRVAVRVNILQLATKTTLASSLNPSHVNQSVKFTATVTGLYAGKTTGSVTFKQGTTVLGTVAVVGGKAALAHVFAKTGTFSISAHFSGDSNNKPNTSNTVSQMVTP
jgi:hypothetical protein